MTDFVQSLLVSRQNLGRENEYVFAASGERGHVRDPGFSLSLVRKATGIEVSPHDLRRTYVTVAESADISPLALKALVNHSLGGGDVTSGYVQMTTERLREPAQRVADKIRELCGIENSDGIKRVGGRP
jgi:integrase